MGFKEGMSDYFQAYVRAKNPAYRKAESAAAYAAIMDEVNNDPQFLSSPQGTINTLIDSQNPEALNVAMDLVKGYTDRQHESQIAQAAMPATEFKGTEFAWTDPQTNTLYNAVKIVDNRTGRTGIKVHGKAKGTITKVNKQGIDVLVDSNENNPGNLQGATIWDDGEVTKPYQGREVPIGANAAGNNVQPYSVGHTTRGAATSAHSSPRVSADRAAEKATNAEVNNQLGDGYLTKPEFMRNSDGTQSYLFRNPYTKDGPNADVDLDLPDFRPDTSHANKIHNEAAANDYYARIKQERGRIDEKAAGFNETVKDMVRQQEANLKMGQSLSKAHQVINGLTVGMIQQFGKNVVEKTPLRDVIPDFVTVDQQLAPIKAQIALDMMKMMKSEAGGLGGTISDADMRLFTESVASLDSTQSQFQIKQSLLVISDMYERYARNAVRDFGQKHKFDMSDFEYKPEVSFDLPDPYEYGVKEGGMQTPQESLDETIGTFNQHLDAVEVAKDFTNIAIDAVRQKIEAGIYDASDGDLDKILSLTPEWMHDRIRSKVAKMIAPEPKKPWWQKEDTDLDGKPLAPIEERAKGPGTWREIERPPTHYEEWRDKKAVPYIRSKINSAKELQEIIQGTEEHMGGLTARPSD